MHLQGYPSLVLNADYRPVSYNPLSLLGWQDAIRLVYQEKVNVLANYEKVVRSPSTIMRIPSVITLKGYVNYGRLKVAFSRYNVFLRDLFVCQYCGTECNSKDLTFDHVVPRSRGGGTNWENIVAACASCNTAKGNKTPSESGMTPIKNPVEPSAFSLQKAGQKFPPKYLHRSWLDFLYWDCELENTND